MITRSLYFLFLTVTIVFYLPPLSLTRALAWFTEAYIYNRFYLYSSIPLISYFIYSYNITFYIGFNIILKVLRTPDEDKRIRAFNYSSKQVNELNKEYAKYFYYINYILKPSFIYIIRKNIYYITIILHDNSIHQETIL